MSILRAHVSAEQRAAFLGSADAQARTEGRRYAAEGKVEAPTDSAEGLTLLVHGESGDYPVTFWIEAGRLVSACECPSWRDPCKHQVAAALTLWPGAPAPDTADVVRDVAAERPDPEVARRHALQERRDAGRSGSMQVRPADDERGVVVVRSDSGYSYRVRLRGGPEGPHGCECPDFEANRLHSCKHVERVRLVLGALTLSDEDVAAADRPRAYLHFGEVVEPRWHGDRSVIARHPPLRELFDAVGRWIGPTGDDATLLRALDAVSEHVEPGSLQWLRERSERVPDFAGADPSALLPPTPLPLHAYQRAGVAFLARTGRALLADEMGLGKTVQAILAAAVLRRARRPVESVTIVCPASLRGGWQDEIRRWLSEDATLLQGNALERAALIRTRPRWLVTHYEQLLRDHEAHHDAPPDLLIVDEAQRVKNLQGATARALKQVDARHVFALTGTPLENRLEEAYAIAQLIDQRLLPPLWQIERDHLVREEGGRRILAYRGLDALRTRLAPTFLRRRKEDVRLELPERVRSTLFVEMHEPALAVHEDCRQQAARIAAKKKLTPLDLEKIQRLLLVCRRACDGAHLLRGWSGDGPPVPKLLEIESLLRDLALGERRKVVVFSEWTDMTSAVERLVRELHLPVYSLHGDVPIGARPQLLRSFHAQEGPAVFVSTDAGGVGLNLQAADVVINVDMPWNPARLEQRLARVHRIGSRRTVHEILLVTSGSIEHGMIRLHEVKRAALENVWATEGEDVIPAPGSRDEQREILMTLLHDETPAAPPAAPADSAAPTDLDVAALSRTLSDVTSRLAPDQRHAVADVLQSLAEALRRR